MPCYWDDTFTGADGSFPANWTDTSTGVGSAQIYSNKFRLDSGTTGVAGEGSASLNTTVSGDFDVRVTLTQALINTLNGTRGYLQFYIDATHYIWVGIIRTNLARYIYAIYNTGSGEGDDFLLLGSDTTTVRITRTGSNCHAYYYTGIWYDISGAIAVGSGNGTIKLVSNKYASLPNAIYDFDDLTFVTGCPASLPTVTTSAATEITATTATGNGEVVSDGGAAITERGFCWSTSVDPTTADSTVVVAGTTGVYSGGITGLVAGNTYHYRAYATNSVGTSYGADFSFATVVSLPTVFTYAATDVTATTATANGEVGSAGGGTILERGFAWSTSPNPTITEDNKVSVSGTTGAFSAALVGLSSDTTYHVRAFATNEAGTAYGTDVSFVSLTSGTGEDGGTGGGGGGGSGGGSTANIAVLYWPDDAGVAYAIDVSTGNLLLFYKRIDTLPYSVDDVIHWNDGFDMVYAASALSLALSTEDDEYDRYRAWVYDNIATSVADILRSISINKKVI